MEAQSVDGDDDDKADSEGGGKVKGGDRILSWVASKGAFYQNSVAVEGGANAKVRQRKTAQRDQTIYHIFSSSSRVRLLTVSH